MEYKDYYRVLGIPRTASAEDIKRAYRKLAREYHPDKNKAKGAEERFKLVNEANEVLSDAKKRQAYDQLGAGWREGQQFTPPPGWDFASMHRGFGGTGGFRGGPGAAGGGFSDFFSTLFGNRSPFTGAGAGPGAGGTYGGFGSFETEGFAATPQDQRVSLTIQLEDSYSGARRTVSIGSRTLSVRIPKGITQGQSIRLARQAASGGDLLLEVQFGEHPIFRPDGHDIHVTTVVAPWEAALGAKVTVPTLGGPVELNIPEGTQAGQKLRLKGRGLPGTPAGDQYVSVLILTPPAASPADRQFYEEMAKRFAGFRPRA